MRVRGAGGARGPGAGGAAVCRGGGGVWGARRARAFPCGERHPPVSFDLGDGSCDDVIVIVMCMDDVYSLYSFLLTTHSTTYHHH